MKQLWKQSIAGCLLSLTALSAYADIVSVTNNSPYAAEVSGAVSVTTDRVLIQPAERAQLDMQPNSVAHLMLIASDGSGYQDNVLVKMNDGGFTAVALYGKEKISVDDKQVTLER